MLKKQVRENLGTFIEQFSLEPEPATHHRYLIDKLQAVKDGKIKRLMVFMPPGGAKSFYANVMMSAWYVGACPGKKLITASYTQEVADKWGRRVRGLVNSPEYADMFDATLSKESSAAGRWELSNKSEYYAVGVRGSVTSFRADIGIIDDPVKGREEAESPTIQQRVQDWYSDDFWTRLKPDAAVIVILTRWHVNDLAGWLLDDMEHGGEKWDVVSIPMEAEENDPIGREVGERLWPEWFTDDMVTQAKRDSRKWWSLYQQKPYPPGGTIFNLEWFKRYTERPASFKRIVQSWDTAVKAKEINDPSVCTTWGETENGYYLLDVQRVRMEYPELKRTMKSQYESWRPHAVLIEDKASGQSLLQDLRRETAMPLIAIEPEGDKVFRASTCSATIEAGNVYIPEAAPWLIDFQNELMHFPNGTHDDQVDSVSQFLNWIRENTGRGPQIRRL